MTDNNNVHKPENTKNATTAMGYFWRAREMLTPTLSTSCFLTKGRLTPDEFVQAGDELVYRCPTWAWCGSSSGSGSKQQQQSYLPADKQYLVTRNVPCRDRVATLERTMDLRCMDDDDCDGVGSDWMVSSMPQEPNVEDDFDVIDSEGEVCKKEDIAVELRQNNNSNAAEEDDEYAEMADFEDDDVLQDSDAVAASGAVHDHNDNDNDHLVKVRTYDLSITYDKYYQTPRIWMSGKSHGGDPLTAAETMEDVMTDYANRTVTMEAHPHLAGPHASIHPCQHAKVMKRIVQNLLDANGGSNNDADGEQQSVNVGMYLFIFLKFVSSIIPTINYDFTMDVMADTSAKK